MNSENPFPPATRHDGEDRDDVQKERRPSMMGPSRDAIGIKTAPSRVEDPTVLSCSSAYQAAPTQSRTTSPSRTGSPSPSNTSRIGKNTRSKRRLKRSHSNKASRAPQPTQDDLISQMLCDYLTRQGNPELKHHYYHFCSAPLDPPITKHSLSELEIGSIVNNAKLRHDICYDRELHFRPNLEGPRGRAKLELHKNYWSAIISEIELYRLLANGLDETAMSKGLKMEEATRVARRRLPKMFLAIRDILQNLVPERDQAQVNSCLDVDVLMQGIERGICDIAGIAQWLARLLKTHCAPMRDSLIDRMVATISKGDSESLSQGLCDIFAVLEAMKLDVANHQIKHLRALLIEDTINFERKYHVARIRRGRFNEESSRVWFQRCLAETSARPRFSPEVIPRSNEPFSSFAIGLVDSVMPSDRGDLPPSFTLDADRIRSIKGEILEEIHLELCLRVFRLCMEEVRPEFEITKQVADTVKSQIKTITPHGSIRSAIPNIAVEIARQVQRLSGDESPLNGTLVEETQALLISQFIPGIGELNDIEQSAREELTVHVLATAQKYLNTSAWDIYNTLVPMPASSSNALHPLVLGRPPSPLQNAQLVAQHASAENSRYSEIANKIAHISVLHWRIWHPIAYYEEDSDSDESPPVTPTDETAPNPIPMGQKTGVLVLFPKIQD